MKKSFALFLSAVFMVAFMSSCNNNSISQEVCFSKIERLSFRTPDEKEIFLNENDKETVLNILSNAVPSAESKELDGGICFIAYIGDKTEWYITVYDSSHISAGTDIKTMYKISESDYTVICDLYEKMQKQKISKL